MLYQIFSLYYNFKTNLLNELCRSILGFLNNSRRKFKKSRGLMYQITCNLDKV